MALNYQVVPWLTNRTHEQIEENVAKSVTALHCAADSGHLSIIEHLLKNFDGDINPPTRDGLTPLHCAAQEGHLDIVSYFTAKLDDPNPSIVSKDKLDGRTPLHLAAQNGYLPIVKNICSYL